MYTYIAIHFIAQQKLTQHCEATIPQLKRKDRNQKHHCLESQIQSQAWSLRLRTVL